jgi:predicted  nucleic acid-binding Zn-ribbon protein
MISVYYVAMIMVIFVVIVFILNRTNMEIKAKKDYVEYQLQLVVDAYNRLAQESSDLVQDFERERAELEKEIARFKNELNKIKEENNI